MDSAGRATLIAGILAALVSLAGALLARYGKRDETAVERQRLADERREKDIETIIGQLRQTIARFETEMKDARVELRGCKDEIARHEQTIDTLKEEKQELSLEVFRLTWRVKELERTAQ